MRRHRRGVALVVLLLVAAACGEAASVPTAVGSPTPSGAVDPTPGLADELGAAGLAGYVREPVLEVADVELPAHVDGATEPFALRARPGTVLALYLGYLNCPDVCPTTMADLGSAVDGLGEPGTERVDVAMLTVDPERDEGEEIAEYLRFFFDGRIAALREEDDTRLRAAAERLRARYEIEEHAPGAERYEVGHTGILYLLDDEGRVVRELPYGVSADAMAATIGRLLDRIDVGEDLVVRAGPA